MTELGEKYGDRRRTKVSTGDELPEFDEAAFIAKENTNVVLTRDGWIKRVGRLASVEGTRGARRRQRPGRGAGQHARSRHLLRRRRHRLHHAHQRGARQLRLRRADHQVLQARRSGQDHRRGQHR